MALSSILILILVVMTLFFLTPSLAVISNIREKNSRLKSIQSGLEQKYENYKLAANYYDAIKTSIPTLLKNIPNESDPYYFVKQANKYSIENGSVLKFIKLVEKGEGVEGYSLNLVGDYTSIENFFKSLKKDERYFSTELLTISPRDPFIESQSNKLSLTAKIYVFYQN